MGRLEGGSKGDTARALGTTLALVLFIVGPIGPIGPTGPMGAAFAAKDAVPLGGGGAVASEVASADPVAHVAQFSGSPFLHEAKWRKGAPPKPKRQTQDAIYNGQRTRVIRVEVDLPLFDGDVVETPGDASMELSMASGDRWLIHPGARAQILDGEVGLVLERGRVTLLSGGASVPAGSLLAGGKRYENLGIGGFVESGPEGIVQGNELKAQEFVGFDDLAIVPLVDADGGPLDGGMKDADGGDRSPKSARPGAGKAEETSSSTRARERVRDENPLDDLDVEEELPSDSTTETGTNPLTPQGNVGSQHGGQPSRGALHLAVGKVIDTAGDALAKEIWSLHGGVVVNLASGVGVALAFDMLPRARASHADGERTHRRWNLDLGARFGTPAGSPVRFFLTPFVGTLALAGRFDVGRGRDGRAVLSDVELGPALVYGLRPEVEAHVGPWSASLLGFAAIRYSSDKVSVRHLGVETRGARGLGFGSPSAQSALSAFLFMRYEDFRTEKDLGRLGRKEVRTGWAIVGLGLGLAF